MTKIYERKKKEQKNSHLNVTDLTLDIQYRTVMWDA